MCVAWTSDLSIWERKRFCAFHLERLRRCLGRCAAFRLDRAAVSARAAGVLRRARDTIEFSYQHCVASLVDFLDARADYRSVQVNYLNLVASYLDAADQSNLAAGREVIQ